MNKNKIKNKILSIEDSRKAVSEIVSYDETNFINTNVAELGRMGLILMLGQSRSILSKHVALLKRCAEQIIDVQNRLRNENYVLDSSDDVVYDSADQIIRLIEDKFYICNGCNRYTWHVDSNTKDSHYYCSECFADFGDE